MRKYKYYAIALRERVSGDRFFDSPEDCRFTELRLPCSKRYWYADPFVLEHDGTTYLFFELYDTIFKKGCIGYCTVDEAMCPSKPRIALKEKFHLSFPYIFCVKGEYFMLPEMRDANCVYLYKAKHFPDKWERYRILAENVGVMDSILVDGNLLSSVVDSHMPPDKLDYCWGQNFIAPVGEGFPTKTEPLSPILLNSGDFGLRNAGDVFIHHGIRYRPGQDSTGNCYGKGLVFHAVSQLSPYREDVLFSVDCTQLQSHIAWNNEVKQLNGVHTYNSSARYEIIDFSYDAYLPITVLPFRRMNTLWQTAWKHIKK